MSNTLGVQLSAIVRKNVEEMLRLCEGIDEETAARAPSGRWMPRQVISHLCGPEGTGGVSVIRTILEKDMPRLDLEAANPFYSENRARMTFRELLGQFEREYRLIAETVSGLTDEQLCRKANVPMLKDSPIGEYPTLAEFIKAMGEYHMDFHIKQMREILQETGADNKG
jgi:hypothetical protein